MNFYGCVAAEKIFTVFLSALLRLLSGRSASSTCKRVKGTRSELRGHSGVTSFIRVNVTAAMVAAMVAAFVFLVASVGGHQSSVIGQSGQWSMLAFQHHGVDQVNQPVNQKVTKVTSTDVSQDDRVLFKAKPKTRRHNVID